MGHVLSIDIGTTNIKGAVVDRHGRLLSLVEQPLPLRRPKSGAAEHDPELVFRAFTSIAKKAASKHASQIDCLILSTYNMSVMAVDRNLKPLTAIITLQDTRNREAFPSLKKYCDTAKLYLRTGCPSIFHYPFAKIWWWKRERPGLIRKTRYFLGVKDYLITRLLGFPLADSSTASASQLFNIHKLNWDSYALRLLGLNADQLPPLVEADKVVGLIPASRAKTLGLSKDLLLVSGLFDGGAVGAGLGAWSGLNVGILNMGTTAMLRFASDRPLLDDGRQMRFSTHYLCGKKWFVGGGVNNAGSVAQWMAQTVFGVDIKTLTREASAVPAGSEGLLMLPFLTGERMPQLKENVSGSLSGLRPYHGRGHIFRAGLEAVAFFLRYLKGSMESRALRVSEFRAGGGGTTSGLWMRIMADVLGEKITLPAQAHPALVGNAMVAYKALGVYKDLSEAGRAMIQPGSTIPSNPALRGIYNQSFERFVERIQQEKDS